MYTAEPTSNEENKIPVFHIALKHNSSKQTVRDSIELHLNIKKPEREREREL